MRDQDGLALKRRLLLMVVGLRPGEVGQAIGFDQVNMSQCLSGDRRLQKDQLRVLHKMIGEQLPRLFGRREGSDAQRQPEVQ